MSSRDKNVSEHAGKHNTDVHRRTRHREGDQRRVWFWLYRCRSPCVQFPSMRSGPYSASCDLVLGLREYMKGLFGTFVDFLYGVAPFWKRSAS